MTQSLRFEIASAFSAAIAAAPALAGVKFRRNPRDPSTVKDGARVVFIVEESDRFVDGKGQQDLRRYTFSLGVINRSGSPEAAEAGADADQLESEAALREAAYGLARAHSVSQLREVQTVFKVEDIDLDGALILTTFEIEYRRAKPARI